MAEHPDRAWAPFSARPALAQIWDRSAVQPPKARTYNVWPVAKASLGIVAIWPQPPSGRCKASNSSMAGCNLSRGVPARIATSSISTFS